MQDKKTILAPAKLNLFLKIVGRKINGYHLIHSGITFLNLFDKIQVEGFSKSKHVTVTVKGNHQIANIKISDDLKDMGLREVEKQILYACNDAMSKVEKEIKSKMGNMMNMPGGFKLPF